jgi:ammonia channel protein AmtB
VLHNFLQPDRCISGAFFMQPNLAMVESCFTRAQNTANIMMKTLII